MKRDIFILATGIVLGMIAFNGVNSVIRYKNLSYERKLCDIKKDLHLKYLYGKTHDFLDLYFYIASTESPQECYFNAEIRYGNSEKAWDELSIDYIDYDRLKITINDKLLK